MVRLSDKIFARHTLDLIISEESPNCIVVEYNTLGKKLLENNLYDDDDDGEYGYEYEEIEGNDDDNELATRLKLLCINYNDDSISIYPRRINPNFSYSMHKKYERVERIILKGFQFKKSKDDDQLFLPKTYHEVLEFLEILPMGFIKDYEYGLGLLGKYRCIIDAIQRDLRINNLMISVVDRTGIDGNTYTLNANDFQRLRRQIDRISRRNQRISKEERERESFNYLMYRADPLEYSEILPTIRKDAVSKLVSGINAKGLPLSKSDHEAVVDFTSRNIKNIYKDQRKGLLKLGEEIELSNLEWLIREMSILLHESNSKEDEWQKLLSENPFIISIVFGYPIVKIRDQASVGGRGLAGSGDKIADFLVKNNLTNNTALVEIKTPGTSLLNLKEYRGGVYSPSRELCGSVSQVLDQKYLFQREINSLKVNTDEYHMESYSVECILIIGRIPKEKERKKSFELFRHNSRDVRIFTFDELFQKLEYIYSFLKEEDDNIPDLDDRPF